MRYFLLVFVLGLAGCGRATVNTTVRHDWTDPDTGYRVSAETTLSWQR